MTLSLKQQHLIDQGTSLHIIVTTANCNLKCVYCQVNSESYTNRCFMDIETAKKTVDFIFQTPSRNITIEFQGGEPTLNFDIIKYVNEYTKEKNKIFKKELDILVVTNLNSMDEEKFDYLINNNISVCTSLDGPKELHNKNRPDDSYDKVVYWIKRFNDRYTEKNINNRIYALITITKESLKYPKEIVDEYVKNGFNEINVREMTQLGCAKKDWNKIGYTIEEFLDFWDKCMEYILELNYKGIHFRERMICIMLNKMLGFQEDFMDLRSPCGAVIGQLVYNYNGDIYSCDEARMIGDDFFKVGTVNNSYNDILSSDKTIQIIKSSINNDVEPCNKCDYKEYCGLCPVCTLAEQGDLIGNIEKTPRCKIYKHIFEFTIKKYINTKDKGILNKWIDYSHG